MCVTSGTIPESIGKLRNLERLLVQENKLQGVCRFSMVRIKGNRCTYTFTLGSLFDLIVSVNGNMIEARASPLWQRALQMGGLEARLMEMTSQDMIRVHICGHAKAGA
jgi:hypothetical protein